MCVCVCVCVCVIVDCRHKERGVQDHGDAQDCVGILDGHAQGRCGAECIEDLHGGRVCRVEGRVGECTSSCVRTRMRTPRSSKPLFGPHLHRFYVLIHGESRTHTHACAPTRTQVNEKLEKQDMKSDKHHEATHDKLDQILSIVGQSETHELVLSNASIPPEVPELPAALQTRPALLAEMKQRVLNQGSTTAVVGVSRGAASTTSAHGMVRADIYTYTHARAQACILSFFLSFCLSLSHTHWTHIHVCAGRSRENDSGSAADT